MRPQIGYSNLYWSNKDKKDMDKKNAALKEEDSVIESEDLASKKMFGLWSVWTTI